MKSNRNFSNWSLNNFVQLKETEYNTFGLPYDYLSLMHYDAFAFSKEEGRLMTIETFDDPSKQDIIGHAKGCWYIYFR